MGQHTWYFYQWSGVNKIISDESLKMAQELGSQNIMKMLAH